MSPITACATARITSLTTGLTELPRWLLLTLVRGYRLFFKPWLGNACRFEPTCSQYALDALQQHGAVTGGAMTIGRLLRCHPWCEGGCDPVPQRAPGLFSRLGLGAETPEPEVPTAKESTS